jgi:hypothetical protein
MISFLLYVLGSHTGHPESQPRVLTSHLLFRFTLRTTEELASVRVTINCVEPA